MFRITRKADYGVFILSFLARRAAEQGDDALVSAHELASFSALNKSLVANLLKDLTRAGFLDSVRGARGGYRLARPAEQISLSEILRAVEGPFSFVECAHERPAAGDSPDHVNCNLTGLCQSQGPLRVLHFRIQQMLANLKLPELAGLDALRELPADAPQADHSQADDPQADDRQARSAAATTTSRATR